MKLNHLIVGIVYALLLYWFVSVLATYDWADLQKWEVVVLVIGSWVVFWNGVASLAKAIE